MKIENWFFWLAILPAFFVIKIVAPSIAGTVYALQDAGFMDDGRRK